jgi:acyl-CoA dehydrogenase
MHQIQLALIIHHGKTPTLESFLRELATDQLLIASATSEVGVGGDARRSICALEPCPNGFRLEKQATCVSYGAEADAILATARRTPESTEEDQAFVLLRPPQLALEPLSGWDAFGLRGTDSRGFRVSGEVESGYVFADSGEVALGRTGVATNNLLQCGVWLGIAEAAAERAHTSVRAKARRDPDSFSAGPLRMAELVGPLQALRDIMTSATMRSESVLRDDEGSQGPGLIVAMNTLKVSASELALEVVHRAMLISGIDGYRNGASGSLGRHVADIYGALIMVNNDRLLLGSSELLRILKSV